jgi:hypothetical protein
MPRPINRIFVYGFPALYGGAGTELHHQIIAWEHMGMDIHLIPTNPGYKQETLYKEMIERGVTVHEMNEWEAIEAGDPVLGFCNAEFLEHLPKIHARTRRTIFTNCMTWLFDKEKERMTEGMIGMFLYQNEAVRQKNMPELQGLNDDPEIRYTTFKPYFENTLFPFIKERSEEHFGCGRISRQDSDKYAKETLHIYEYFVSPKFKKGLFLGYDHRAQEKIGQPFDWITVATDQAVCSQQDFYKHCEIILQPTDTTENWPRVGFEAMSSGSVLIVDKRGGWEQMVKHGETGWLCERPRDFIYYASKMAYEPNMRDDMAEASRLHCQELGGLEASITSWEEVFEEIGRMPE